MSLLIEKLAKSIDESINHRILYEPIERQVNACAQAVSCHTDIPGEPRSEWGRGVMRKWLQVLSFGGIALPVLLKRVISAAQGPSENGLKVRMDGIGRKHVLPDNTGPEQDRVGISSSGEMRTTSGFSSPLCRSDLWFNHELLDRNTTMLTHVKTCGYNARHIPVTHDNDKRCTATLFSCCILLLPCRALIRFITMKFIIPATWLTASALVQAAPIAKRQSITNADILQYALTLEHLENAFYNGALNTMPEAEFLAAGFSSAYYNNLKYIAHDEEQHVALLTSALTAVSASPVAAGTYDFPYNDAKSFVALASVLEGVGVSAYLGAAPDIVSAEYLTVAGSILVTEALHQSVQRFNLGQVAPANPYGTPLGLDEVYTLAAAFITSLPSTNMALPVMAFPTLAAVQGIPAAPGITFVFEPPKGVSLPSEYYVTFSSGLDVISMPASIVGGFISATIPTTASGQVYAILTNANTTSITNGQILAGPAIIEVTPNSPTF
ncbi:hypothetical protein ANO11243_018230 [Dothideomycetidae sp. 11243]|nr:hypothetical protein ANO11243_018230 [fungal sp. No.11243]